jgi:hypothetical protein
VLAPPEVVERVVLEPEVEGGVELEGRGTDVSRRMITPTAGAVDGGEEEAEKAAAETAEGREDGDEEEALPLVELPERSVGRKMEGAVWMDGSGGSASFDLEVSGAYQRRRRLPPS